MKETRYRSSCKQCLDHAGGCLPPIWHRDPSTRRRRRHLPVVWSWTGWVHRAPMRDGWFDGQTPSPTRGPTAGGQRVSAPRSLPAPYPAR